MLDFVTEYTQKSSRNYLLVGSKHKKTYVLGAFLVCFVVKMFPPKNQNHKTKQRRLYTFTPLQKKGTQPLGGGCMFLYTI